MNIDNLEKRIELDSVRSNLTRLGWTPTAAGESLVVSPCPGGPTVMISHVCYKLCGNWIRPLYGRIDLETYVSVERLGLALLELASNTFGTISVTEVDPDAGCMVIIFRVLIPTEIDHVELAEGILSTVFGVDDLKNWANAFHYPE